MVFSEVILLLAHISLVLCFAPSHVRAVASRNSVHSVRVTIPATVRPALSAVRSKEDVEEEFDDELELDTLAFGAAPPDPIVDPPAPGGAAAGEGGLAEGEWKIEASGGASVLGVAVAGKELRLESGELARLASGAVTARCGGTLVLATACLEKLAGGAAAKPIDFTPLPIVHRVHAPSAVSHLRQQPQEERKAQHSNGRARGMCRVGRCASTTSSGRARSAARPAGTSSATAGPPTTRRSPHG